MRYFTAAFGEPHRIVVDALVRSFGRYEPDASLTVFTDLDDGPMGAETASMEALLQDRETFYHRPRRRNIFKFSLFAEMFRRYPGEPVAWLDADMLLLGDLSARLDPAKVNVLAHGRRDDETVALGDGVEVPGSRFAVGAFFSLPDPSWLERLEEVTARRPAWDHRDHSSNSGDQLILNHVVAAADSDEVNWVTDDRTAIYNLEIAEGLHPFLGDPGLRSLTRRGEALYQGARQVILFCWIKRQFDNHLADGFETFQPEVRSLLRSLYMGEAEPTPRGGILGRLAKVLR